ncbi:pentatricopeptide repeat-containing At3g02490, mitochondrial-like [Olea europaea subsp. europaea]|uniref:Pentatricopeptide repeat-containing At3g02490, mitochondrial-like n=1 Tax=Olea europaea subsp. europaea TaxID=158383 RepID=A0A8S0SGK5_OLEEU|nr:pentatricopeptide repeat-containing At3g02490, mitochondrial-like [Olea europaea subsp. europaea]
MRNQWPRLLLLRCYHTRSQLCISRQSQVNCLPSFTPSFLYSRKPKVIPRSFILIRHFSSSSELAEESKSTLDQAVLLLTDIFAKPGKSNDEIKIDLDSNNVDVTHDLVLSVLENSSATPDAAKRVFDWVLESKSKKLSSKSYNLMLGILGSNGFVNEFWDMVGIMKQKGYGVSKGTYAKVFENFEKDELYDEVDKLNKLFSCGSAGNKSSNAEEEVCQRVCKIVKQEVWGDDVEKQLRELNVEFSSNLVSAVLESLEVEPNKGLIFFRWIEESGLLKHNEQTFNAMARVLARVDYCDKFWKIVNEMRGAEYEMERETYVKGLRQFVNSKMMKDAVDLYEFAMIGENKPSIHDCTFLLKKIVVSKELDMDLFSRVVTVFKANGNMLTDANLDAVLKSLTSVGRIGECNKILKAMKEGGYLPSGYLQNKIAFQLSSGGKAEEALEFMDNMEASGTADDYKAWVSSIKGYCEARDLDKASDRFRKMVEKEGASSVVFALDMLSITYCRKNRAMDAFKLVSEMVNSKGLRPWHSTYKELTSKLLARKRFLEALDVMTLMKNQGYPPYLNPFIAYLSKVGSADDAVTFSKATSSKSLPSMSIYLRLFEAYFKKGRRSEAQDFLSKCPRYIRNHADVLNLFVSIKSKDAAETAAVTA